MTYSSDGVTCGACPAGTGPTDDSTGCLPCQGNNFSSFGVCLPCADTLIAAKNHKQCDMCPDYQTGIALIGTDGTVGRATCMCEDGYYNATERLHTCYHGAYDAAAYCSSLKAHESLLLEASLAQKKHQPCMRCPTDIMRKYIFVVVQQPLGGTKI